MTQVKFNNEKWWVLHQEYWVEIIQKDWEKVKIEVYENQPCSFKSRASFTQYKNWFPTTDQIYSLANEVEFEIRKNTCKNCNGNGIQELSYDTCLNCNGKKYFEVAHLKESEPKLADFCKNGCESTSHCIDTCSKYLRAKVERSEEVKKEPNYDQFNLEKIIVAWLKSGNENTSYLTFLLTQKIKDNLFKITGDSQSEIESLREENNH